VAHARSPTVLNGFAWLSADRMTEAQFKALAQLLRLRTGQTPETKKAHRPAKGGGLFAFGARVRVCPSKYFCVLCVYACLSVHNRAHGQAQGRSRTQG